MADVVFVVVVVVAMDSAPGYEFFYASLIAEKGCCLGYSLRCAAGVGCP